MNRYLLDANIFIYAHRKYYAFDIVPSFWSELKRCAEAGHIISLDRIKREIDDYPETDALKKWANREFSSYFVSTDNKEVISAYQEIINWAVAQPQFTAAAKDQFARVADSWLIAAAKAFDCILVTHELFDENVRRKIPIPNVCRHFGIPYIDTFDMLRGLKIQL